MNSLNQAQLHLNNAKVYIDEMADIISIGLRKLSYKDEFDDDSMLPIDRPKEPKDFWDNLKRDDEL